MVSTRNATSALRARVLVGLFALCVAGGCRPGEAVPAEPLVIRVTGSSYEWLVHYPGVDGQFGTDDDRHAAGTVHVPEGRAVRIELRSRDYLYTFGLPDFDLKQIAVPDLLYTLELTPSEVGSYTFRGDQLCGYRHDSLIGSFVVETRADFESWHADLRRGAS